MTSRGEIPCGPIKNLLDAWWQANTDFQKMDKNGGHLGNLGKVCALTGLAHDHILAIVNGRRQSISFDVADRLVITLHRYGAFGWWLEPDLREVYEGFDFGPLDRKKPTDRPVAVAA